MYGALHPKSNVDFYFDNSEENLIKEVAADETINTEDPVTSGEFKKPRAQELKQNWHEKKMHRQFAREMPEKVYKDRTWQWLSKINLKIGIEALLCAAQEQAIRTNYVKHHIDKTSESLL